MNIPSTVSVAVFTEPAFGGIRRDASPGIHRPGQGELAGVPEDSISSVIVEIGFLARLFADAGGTGKNAELAAGAYPSLAAFELDNQTSRVVIEEADPSELFGRLLRRGCGGRDVILWQAFLASRGLFPGRADSVFGPLTETQTKEFQRQHGLIDDGIVGRRTRKRANAPGMEVGYEELPLLEFSDPVLRLGNTGDTVKCWQVFLASQGFFPGFPDGRFGDRVQQQTKAFQRDRGLADDGVVGTQTWHAANTRGFVDIFGGEGG